MRKGMPEGAQPSRALGAVGGGQHRVCLDQEDAGFSEDEGRLAARVDGAPLERDQPPNPLLGQRQLASRLSRRTASARPSPALHERAGAVITTSCPPRRSSPRRSSRSSVARPPTMPTLMAATQSRTGVPGSARPDHGADGVRHGDEAARDGRVRVPPSAWMTSQSIPDGTLAELSPSRPRHAASADEPLDSWRAPAGPLRSRFMRVLVERGRHAVLRGHPALPCPLRNCAPSPRWTPCR